MAKLCRVADFAGIGPADVQGPFKPSMEPQNEFQVVLAMAMFAQFYVVQCLAEGHVNQFLDEVLSATAPSSVIKMGERGKSQNTRVEDAMYYPMLEAIDEKLGDNLNDIVENINIFTILLKDMHYMRRSQMQANMRDDTWWKRH